MAGQQGIRAGKAFVELTTNDKKLVKGLRSVQRKLLRFGSMITGMGAKLLGAATAITGPIIAAANSFAKFGDSVNKMSARTGLGAEAVSSLGFAAEQSGTDIKTLEKGFQGMARFMLNAERGLSTATDSMEDLGLSMSDLQGKSPEDQFKTIADRLAGIEDPSRKAALAMSIFGKSGSQLLPLLSSGASGISALQKEAQKLGITLSDEDAQAAADLTDAVNRMKRAMFAAWMNGGAALADGMTKIADFVAKAATSASKFIKENQALVMKIVAVGTAVGVAAGLLLSFGTAVFLASAAMGGLATVASAIFSVLGFITSPLGLVVAGLAGVVYYSGLGGEALDWLSGRFSWLGEVAGNTFGAVKQALNAGEFKKAAEVLWAGLKVAWLKGTQGLSVALAEWRTFFTDVWEKAIDNGARFFINAWAKLQEAWTHITQFIGDAWSIAMTGMANAYIELQKFIAKKEIEAQFEAEFGEIKEGSNEAITRQGVINFSNSEFDKKKTKIEADQNKVIVDRGKNARAELNRIGNQRTGSLGVIDEEAKKRNDARDARLLDARQNAKDRVTDAEAALKKLTTEISELAKNNDSKVQEQQNKLKNLSAPSLSSRGGASGGSGLRGVISFINKSTENKTVEELQNSHVWYAQILDQLKKNQINPVEAD